ncbi:MAG: rod shape-determining protein MreD [Anaerolineae bacterium]|nr:rod shape-determining protein MreD [Anaerolineae bacterium]MDW8071651.1 rod shape-determining protein MreD [Anaerolineae bacterium]
MQIVLLFALVLIESSWGHLLSIGGVHPDLVLLAVISWTALRGATEGWMWAVIGGIGLDLFSNAPFGLSIISLLLVCLFVSMAHSRVHGTSLVLPLLLAFPMSLIYYAFSMFFLILSGYPLDWNATLLRIALPASLLNGVTILIFFPLLRALHQRTLPRVFI